jgi:hypothetical protein
VGQIISGNIPGASLPDEFATSSSTGIVRVLASSEWLERRMTQLKASPGKAGGVNPILAPGSTPEISVSGTKTIRRGRETCCNRSIGAPAGEVRPP